MASRFGDEEAGQSAAPVGVSRFGDLPAEGVPKTQPTSIDWSQVLSEAKSNAPKSSLHLIQSLAGGGDQAPNPNPSGRFSQAHPDVANRFPMIASAADSVEELAHNVAHPVDHFAKDPAGAAQLWGNLARGGFNLATSAPATAAAGGIADVGAAAGSGLKAAAPDLATGGAVIAGGKLAGGWPGAGVASWLAKKTVEQGLKKGAESFTQTLAQRRLARVAEAQRQEGRTPLWTGPSGPPPAPQQPVDPLPPISSTRRAIGPQPAPPPDGQPRTPLWSGVGEPQLTSPEALAR
jgi:hypothetical protein